MAPGGTKRNWGLNFRWEDMIRISYKRNILFAGVEIVPTKWICDIFDYLRDMELSDFINIYRTNPIDFKNNPRTQFQRPSNLIIHVEDIVSGMNIELPIYVPDDPLHPQMTDYTEDAFFKIRLFLNKCVSELFGCYHEKCIIQQRMLTDQMYENNVCDIAQFDLENDFEFDVFEFSSDPVVKPLLYLPEFKEDLVLPKFLEMTASVYHPILLFTLNCWRWVQNRSLTGPCTKCCGHDHTNHFFSSCPIFHDLQYQFFLKFGVNFDPENVSKILQNRSIEPEKLKLLSSFFKAFIKTRDAHVHTVHQIDAIESVVLNIDLPSD